jgi:hypothetical protein
MTVSFLHAGKFYAEALPENSTARFAEEKESPTAGTGRRSFEPRSSPEFYLHCTRGPEFG